jgi:hypothetical protein
VVEFNSLRKFKLNLKIIKQKKQKRKLLYLPKKGKGSLGWLQSDATWWELGSLVDDKVLRRTHLSDVWVFFWFWFFFFIPIYQYPYFYILHSFISWLSLQNLWLTIPVFPSNSLRVSFCALQTTKYAGAIGGLRGAYIKGKNISTENAPAFLWNRYYFPE